MFTNMVNNSLFIVIQLSIRYLLFGGLNMQKFVFLIFKDNLLAQSQLYKCFSSWFMLLIEMLISIYGYDW